MAKIKGQVKWFNESKGLASLLRLTAAKMCSYFSAIQAMVSKLWLKARTLSSKFRTARKVRLLLT